MNRILIIIILLGTLLRVIDLSQPLLEGASTRQVQTAMIARNYYNHGFKILLPQVEGYGNGTTYQMQEFYITPFIAALFYKFIGGVQEEILRLISVFAYLLATIMLYRLAAYYFDKKVGVISAFCFAISPLSIYLGRAVHPEMLMIFFNMAAIYSFSRWIYEDKNIYGFLGAGAFVLAVLLKVPNLYLLLPLAFIAFVKFNWHFIRQPKLWFFLIGCLVPIAAFNYHQHLIRIAFPNAAMNNFKLDVIIDLMRVFLTNKEFYKATYENLITYTLTPIGFALFIFGLMLRLENKRELLLYLWLFSVAVFFVLMPAQSRQGYYQMHLLPIACIIIARALGKFCNSQFYRDYLSGMKTAHIFFLLVTFIVVGRYAFAFYRVPENFRYVVATGQAIEQLTEKDALVIASIENGPDLVYYGNRKGWAFMINLEEARKQDLALGLDIAEEMYNPILCLENLRNSGAQYFASASMQEFLGHQEFSSYMYKNYRAIRKTPHFIIFDISTKKSFSEP